MFETESSVAQQSFWDYLQSATSLPEPLLALVLADLTDGGYVRNLPALLHFDSGRYYLRSASSISEPGLDYFTSTTLRLLSASTPSHFPVAEGAPGLSKQALEAEVAMAIKKSDGLTKDQLKSILAARRPLPADLVDEAVDSLLAKEFAELRGDTLRLI